MPGAHEQPQRSTERRISRLGYLALIKGDDPADRQYELAHWFWGLGDVSTHWAPAVCASEEMPSPFSKTDAYYRYGPRFKLGPDSSTFGCREWGYQLYDAERPYIDVTSYVPKDKIYPHGTYIRDFVGWFRFEDRKPVIGRHENRWYCLYECPDAEAPGPIDDIDIWAGKHGWTRPKPPTKAPTFPDPPARSGNYRR